VAPGRLGLAPVVDLLVAVPGDPVEPAAAARGHTMTSAVRLGDQGDLRADVHEKRFVASIRGVFDRPGPSPREARMSEFPRHYLSLKDAEPKLFEAYNELGRVAAEAAPLDARTRELVRLGIAIGARMEGAVHAHVRRALEVGCSADEIRHAVLLATTTIGFPTMMAARSWAEDILEG